MKEFVFVSDFDGTITHQDFYLQLLHRYLPERMERELKDFKSKARSDFDVLAGIFADVGITKAALDDEIAAIPVDTDFPALVADVEALGGSFVILSAGCGYYIRRVLQLLGLEHISVYANEGVYQSGGIRMLADTASPFYSAWYGVDKSAVLRALQADYHTVWFAGDSKPDLAPAKLAHMRFAKPYLAELLHHDGVDSVPVACIAEIRTYLAAHPPVVHAVL